ncbi:MAG TPA: PsbP-related protein [Nitrososphaeraceae archaeon]
MKRKIIPLSMTLTLLIGVGLLHSSFFSLLSSSSTTVFSKIYADDVSNQSLTYKDSLNGFKFEYPSHWNQTMGKNAKDTGVAFDLSNFTSIGPSGVSVYTDRFQENRERLLQIEPEENEERSQENMSLKQYMQDFIYAEYCCVDYKSIKFNESKLGGIHSMNVSWNHVDDNKTIIGKNWMNFALKNGVAYVIYYHTPTEASFDKFLPQVKGIISSFKLSGNLSKII